MNFIFTFAASVAQVTSLAAVPAARRVARRALSSGGGAGLGEGPWLARRALAGKAGNASTAQAPARATRDLPAVLEAALVPGAAPASASQGPAAAGNGTGTAAASSPSAAPALAAAGIGSSADAAAPGAGAAGSPPGTAPAPNLATAAAAPGAAPIQGPAAGEAPYTGATGPADTRAGAGVLVNGGVSANTSYNASGGYNPHMGGHGSQWFYLSSAVSPRSRFNHGDLPGPPRPVSNKNGAWIFSQDPWRS